MKEAALPVGKLQADLLRRLLEAPLPADVLLGPRVGEDAAALQVPAGALIAAADPITLTGSDAGAHAVRVNANDVAVCGARPRWFLATVLLPVGTVESQVVALFTGMRRALTEIDATLVGGHTEVTPSVTQPLVCGQMLGVCQPERVIRTSGVSPGDVVLQVGPAPIEAAAVLASEASDQLQALEAGLLIRARDALRRPGISVIDPALRAADLGAIALHDPTEGGLSAGLHELAEASGVSLRLAEDQVLWFEPGVAACRALGADPWGALASGALLAGFRPAAADAARAELRAAGFEVARIGAAETGSGVFLSTGQPLRRHERDELSRVLGG